MVLLLISDGDRDRILDGSIFYVKMKELKVEKRKREGFGRTENFKKKRDTSRNIKNENFLTGYRMWQQQS